MDQRFLVGKGVHTLGIPVTAHGCHVHYSLGFEVNGWAPPGEKDDAVVF